MDSKNSKTLKWSRRRKRTSKRRWKKRCQLGRLIPAFAILEYKLDETFVFQGGPVNMDAYHAIRKVPRKNTLTGRMRVC